MIRGTLELILFGGLILIWSGLVTLLAHKLKERSAERKAIDAARNPQ